MTDSTLHYSSSREGLASVTKLNNGVEMPRLGLGLYQNTDPVLVNECVRAAIEAGYRRFDTAAVYGNESEFGRALRETGVARSEVFITTKIWNTDLRALNVPEAFEQCMERLDADYVDLLLVHWPVGEANVAAWKQMESIYRDGGARAIGVSNYLKHHLEELLASAEVCPAVNQIELHPCLQSPELRRFCLKKGIQVEAWSPLMQGRILANDVLKEIAERHAKSAAQIVLRWHLQMGVMVIPKSARSSRVVENGEVFDFHLTDKEIEEINRLESGGRIGPDPDNVEF